MIKVAFQGTRGAYSEEALYKYFSEDVEAVGFELSEQVCEALREGEVAMGILPVENSIVGNVTVNLDLLHKYNVFAIGEVYFPINHCLLAKPGVRLEEIRSVHSHPIALAQCRDFLNKHEIKSIPEYDTAGSSKLLAEKDVREEATISSALCAEYYDLEVINNDVQKVKNNITRFLIFVNEENIPDGIAQEKTSIAFSTNHNPGALLNCLQQFAEHNLNLTKLESRPIPENPFMYTFFVDFMGSINDKNVKDCLINLNKDTKSIKVLGCYPEGHKVLRDD
jgi:prephenate dehydratase